ncbi:hypothetical protein [Streptomyces caniscabiei]|uniref:hypothetical protein n=1 Tax=Streptomyces caniscabiei TaxID=2746961 RepID=UPI0029623BA8|nr:hypothetical protein [Streptomyces caniscabiei]
MVGELLLRAEGQASYGGVEAVGPDHEVEGEFGLKALLDGLTPLVEGRHAGT